MAAVILRWSERLNANDNAGIARLYSVPALIVQGAYATGSSTGTRWRSGIRACRARGRSSGSSSTAGLRLPCSGSGDRGKTKCDAPGSLAAARFEIVKGKIRSWVQVEVPPKPGAACGLSEQGKGRAEALPLECER